MKTNYRPRVGVWEITYACNMRCQHCGSSCGLPLPDEFTSDEALNLCDDLGKLGLERLTLSGGEPFMRPDWAIIARRLTQNGITVNAISNGWYIIEGSALADTNRHSNGKPSGASGTAHNTGRLTKNY